MDGKHAHSVTQSGRTVTKATKEEQWRQKKAPANAEAKS